MAQFYAAVAMREDPSLVGKPVAVGGIGMISTANYVARRSASASDAGLATLARHCALPVPCAALSPPRDSRGELAETRLLSLSLSLSSAVIRCRPDRHS